MDRNQPFAIGGRGLALGLAVALLVFTPALAEVRITGDNHQAAHITGSASNSASGNAEARQNIAANSGNVVIRGSNTQTVSIRGSASNVASGSGKAVQNLGSVSGGLDDVRAESSSTGKGKAKAKADDKSAAAERGAAAAAGQDPSCWMAPAHAQGRCVQPAPSSGGKDGDDKGASQKDKDKNKDREKDKSTGEPSPYLGNGMGTLLSMMPEEEQRRYTEQRQKETEEAQRECRESTVCVRTFGAIQAALSIAAAIPSCGASATGVGAAACLLLIDSASAGLVTAAKGKQTETLFNQAVDTSLKVAGVKDHQRWANYVEFATGFIAPGKVTGGLAGAGGKAVRAGGKAGRTASAVEAGQTSRHTVEAGMPATGGSHMAADVSLEQAIREVRDIISPINNRAAFEANDMRYRTNCAACAATTFETFATGAQVSAVPRLSGDSIPLPMVHRMHGHKFPPEVSVDYVIQRMSAAEDGTQGIISVTWKTAPTVDGVQFGHVFNVTKYKGSVLFVDGQTGHVGVKPSSWDQIDTLEFSIYTPDSFDSARNFRDSGAWRVRDGGAGVDAGREPAGGNSGLVASVKKLFGDLFGGNKEARPFEVPLDAPPTPQGPRPVDTRVHDQNLGENIFRSIEDASGGDGIRWLLRGDSRPPDEVFNSGFRAWGDDMNPVNHYYHYSKGTKLGGYISTAYSFEIATAFPPSGGYVYVVRPAQALSKQELLESRLFMWDTTGEYGSQAILNETAFDWTAKSSHWPGPYDVTEVIVAKEIRPGNIIGAYQVDGKIWTTFERNPNWNIGSNGGADGPGAK